MKTRTLVIGDIHGGMLGLTQVLERMHLIESDQLVFLGDYVDGWSGSFEVIDFLHSFQEKYKCVFIKGNHDAWCEDWLSSGKTPDVWRFNGGQATMDSYIKASSEQKQKHLEFFNRMSDYYIDDMNRLFIHAGYSSMHGPAKEHYTSNYSWDRTLWETAVATDKTIKKNSALFPKRLKLFTEIYIGHTPTPDYGSDVPLNFVNVWNIDTGAAFTGKLSALDIDTKQHWQSDSLQELYPNEKGRNND